MAELKTFHVTDYSLRMDTALLQLPVSFIYLFCGSYLNYQHLVNHLGWYQSKIHRMNSDVKSGNTLAALFHFSPV